MKHIILILFFSLNASISNAQYINNLVINSSFEDFTINKCILSGNYSVAGYQGWFDTAVKFENHNGTFSRTSPDAYNTDTCDSHPQWNNHVPFNSTGYQWPKKGNGYVGFSYLGFGEYISGTLHPPLKKNNNYCISFNVSLAEISTHAPKNLKIVFHSDSTLIQVPYTSVIGGMQSNFNQELNKITPIVLKSDFLRDTVEWIKLEANFIAPSAYTFFTIGLFDSTHSTTHLRNQDITSSRVSYLYLDDVLIYDCSDTIPPPEPVFAFEVKAYPNPASEWFSLEYTLPQASKVRVHITDVFGKIVMPRTELQGQKGVNTFAIDATTWAMGQYHISVLYEGNGRSEYKHLKMQVVR